MSKKAIVYFIPAPSAGYTGPGDIVSGATAWWGLRGYNAAYCTGSNPAMDVVDAATGLITTTINILSNGDLDNATLSGLGYAVKVKKLYDQTGNGHHLDTVNNLASSPSVTLNALGSLSVVTFDGSASQRIQASSAFPSQAQPFTVSLLAARTSHFTTYGTFVACNSTDPEIQVDNTTNTWRINAGGTALTTTVSDSSYHALQFVFNGASSILYLDGTQTTGLSPGTHGYTADSGGPIWGRDSFGNYIYGNIGENGWWPAAFTTPQQSSMDSNQHTYWGF
jgi:hypothetical protein